MAGDDRYTEVQRRRMDEELKRIITRDPRIRRVLLEKLRPEELLNHITTVSASAKQEIQQECRNYGQRRGASSFLDKVPMYNRWALQFLDALYHTGMEDIAKRLRNDYRPPPDDSDDDDDDGDGDDGGGDGDGRLGQPVNDDSNILSSNNPPSYEETISPEMRDRIKQRMGENICTDDQVTKMDCYRNSSRQRRNEASDAYNPEPSVTDPGEPHQSTATLHQPSAEPDEQPPPYTPQPQNDQVVLPQQRQSNAEESEQSTSANQLIEETPTVTSVESSQPDSSVQSRNSLNDASSAPDTVDNVIRGLNLNDLSPANNSTNVAKPLTSLNVDGETEITTSCNNPVSEESSRKNTISESNEVYAEIPFTSNLKEFPIGSRIDADDENERHISNFETASLHLEEPSIHEPSKSFTSDDIEMSEDSAAHCNSPPTDTSDVAGLSSSECGSCSSSSSMQSQKLEVASSVESDESSQATKNNNRSTNSFESRPVENNSENQLDESNSNPVVASEDNNIEKNHEEASHDDNPSVIESSNSNHTLKLKTNITAGACTEPEDREADEGITDILAPSTENVQSLLQDDVNFVEEVTSSAVSVNSTPSDKVDVDAAPHVKTSSINDDSKLYTSGDIEMSVQPLVHCNSHPTYTSNVASLPIPGLCSSSLSVQSKTSEVASSTECNESFQTSRDTNLLTKNSEGRQVENDSGNQLDAINSNLVVTSESNIIQQIHKKDSHNADLSDPDSPNNSTINSDRPQLETNATGGTCTELESREIDKGITDILLPSTEKMQKLPQNHADIVGEITSFTVSVKSDPFDKVEEDAPSIVPNASKESVDDKQLKLEEDQGGQPANLFIRSVGTIARLYQHVNSSYHL